jgi:hypothetical protein
VLDFARVAVLYILQEESTDDAQTAQNDLQSFFTDADSSSGKTQSEASSLKIGGDNTIDLVNYSINVGNGTVGGSTSTKRDMVDSLWLRFRRGQDRRLDRRGGAVLPHR